MDQKQIDQPTQQDDTSSQTLPTFSKEYTRWLRLKDELNEVHNVRDTHAAKIAEARLSDTDHLVGGTFLETKRAKLFIEAKKTATTIYSGAEKQLQSCILGLETDNLSNSQFIANIFHNEPYDSIRLSSLPKALFANQAPIESEALAAIVERLKTDKALFQHFLFMACDYHIGSGEPHLRLGKIGIENLKELLAIHTGCKWPVPDLDTGLQILDQFKDRYLEGALQELQMMPY